MIHFISEQLGATVDWDGENQIVTITKVTEIQGIRASERRFYQKITDVYATAVDYDKNSKTTKEFYATVQNKMHYAVHGNTDAEVIVSRANHKK